MIKYESKLPENISNGKPITFDVRFKETGKKKPVVLFLHGFKGFKDWGHFNILASEICKANYVFVKMNFSHNGTTPEQLCEFADLEAFGLNNYSLELDDAGHMIDHIMSSDFKVPENEADKDQLVIIGHSRGGGAAILKANEDSRIKKLITWASINDHAKRWPTQDMNTWEKEGVHYITNGRTNQQMPMEYQIVENYEANQDRLDIPKAVKNMSIPFLAIHGSLDEAVPKEILEEFDALNSNIQTLLIPKAGHTFGGKHPYDRHYLSPIGKELLMSTLNFITQ